MAMGLRAPLNRLFVKHRPKGDMRNILIDDDTWAGGYYELAMEFGPTPDPRIDQAITALYNYPLLEKADDYGIAQLSEAKRVVFRMFHIPEEDGQDWLVFGIPFGALAKVYNTRGFPFGSADDTSSREWRTILEHWLIDLGRYMYNHVPYRLGIIGHEVSGDAYAEDILLNGVPDERWFSYLWPTRGELHVYLINKWEPPYTLS